MKRRIKFAVSLGVRAFDILRGGLLRLLGRLPPSVCVILYYHAVPRAARAGFARQMDELLRLARPIRCDESDGLRPGERYAAVTFDDGFVSVLDHALPELEARSIPVTIFVPSGSLGQRPLWVRDPQFPTYHEQVASAELLARIGEHPLVSIGSHSVSHPNFLKIEEGDASVEFSRSKQRLEEILGRKVTLFSFPHGAHNSRLVEMAREAGYSHVFTIEPNLAYKNSAERMVGRVAVEPDDWPMEFRLKLAGAYRWLAKSWA